MQLMIRQRILSWFDSFDITDENGETVYIVKGQLDWGHCFRIYDRYGAEVGMIKEKILTIFAQFELYENGYQIGTLKREFTLLKPRFTMDMNGWSVNGDYLGWNYRILAPNGLCAASISKKIISFTDTYLINVFDPENALYSVMIAVAIDAYNCSKKD